MLLLKKDIEWIQPATATGINRDAIPMQPIHVLFEKAKTVKEAGFTDWASLERADLKPGKGSVKFVSSSNYEVQIDTHTAEILAVEYRRSDIIEKLHDGSWFADWAKYWIFLPSGILLFILWLTGIYLFFLPHYKKWQKRKKKRNV
ncbi:hypothetical protein GCM10017044_23900 [Kordiimonas sediminis]|uniref:PepSY domain-containing protein n=1 Tax=Kordiimonas sediminis TaxID=1735581 RepID=A0A919AXE3_9PROT|nr:hypothetical protein GCM10017044_23900 [Kordiimonas sediminis]